MRWKSVAIASAAFPIVVGCNIVHYAARNIVNEPLVVCTQTSIECELRKQARSAWEEVRGEYPRRAFTSEFHDGFLDGYVDYLDRGGNGSLPAVPPSKYTRHKKYFTENGQCLVKDYFLGFKYGQEIAIATGKRQFLTVPVLLPQQSNGPPAFTLLPTGATLPLMAAPRPLAGIDPSIGKPAVATPEPKQSAPVPKPPDEPRNPTPILPAPKPLPAAVPDTPPVSQFTPVGPPADPDALPIPNPPLPVLAMPTSVLVNPPPVIEVPLTVPVVPRPAPKLPPPPAEVPELPAHVPTPSTLDELPVIAPVHTMPPVVAPSHPAPLGK